MANQIIPLAGAVLCEDCQMITQATQSVCLACGSKAIYSLQAMLEKGYRMVRLTGIVRERPRGTPALPDVAQGDFEHWWKSHAGPKNELAKLWAEAAWNASKAAVAEEQRGKWPECQRYESATGEIFNVRLVNKPENKIVYTRSDIDLNGIFTVTLSEWLADLGEQRGEASEVFTVHIHQPASQPLGEMACPQCGNAKDDPREDSIERMLVCGDSFHSQQAQPLPARDITDHELLKQQLPQYWLAYVDKLEAELSRLISERDAANEATKSTLASLAEMPRLIFESNQAVRAELASKEEQGGWTICPNCKAGFDPTPLDSRKEP